ncbi:GTP 3',8-cyclase MoaA [Candidatus Albibeggiatoa sp. nov. NOAA]|uniref:GTP 3',8-cyclase MoaA n=1 Tax=Candidatus Albibeggiatoa sp. nov. NOAA TaxID=3162724 RepID=UPI0032FB64DC|nr:GTP 3',8-cyclase MoaA [Thiotrichaceae bacterium]
MVEANPLKDSFGRKIEYLRLSVTDRCDLRCFYCIPKGFKDFSTPSHWLTFDEIERIIAIFGQLGVSKLRLTGGEPLVRKNLPELVQRLGQLEGIEDLSLSTNATQLGKYAETLRANGVSRINVSLDTLNPERFQHITGGNLSQVLQGLQAAKQAGFHPIKINMVIMKGVNDDEVAAMVDYCAANDFTLRFIETMPMGETGQDASQNYISLQDIKSQLAKQYTLIPTVMGRGAGPARYFQIQGTNLKIGFITPLSQHFCETCNRIRLSVEGTLYLCLGQDDKIELRDVLRQGISDAELRQLILQAIALKPEKHEFNQKPEQVVRIMSMSGG